MGGEWGVIGEVSGGGVSWGGVSEGSAVTSDIVYFWQRT